MKKPLSIVWLLFLLFVFSPAVAQDTSSPSGIVVMPLANVHEDPLPGSKLATQILLGEEVRILGKEGTRYHIAIADQGGFKGWVQQEALVIPRDAGKHYLNPERQWIVVSVPKTEALVLDRTGDHKVPIYGGTRLPVIEQKAVGLKVRFPDRSVAIIDPADTIAEKPSDPLANDTAPEDIAAAARRFKGVRHLDGGMTAQGIDTGGLIAAVYRIHGFVVGRDRAVLAEKAERIAEKKDLRPGDILIFSGGGEGLYLGSGRFLQSVRRGGVRVEGIHDRRYSRSFQYGLRVIGADPYADKRVADLTADEILLTQARVARLPLGERIAYWAGRFIGTPYDPDPLGLYVRTNRIVADEKVDCMYHTFRSVELAESDTPGEAVARALDLRFLTRGRLADGIVVNYDDRFQYGEDMVFSGKWGRNITADLGPVRTIPGSRGRDTVDILPKSSLLTRALQKKLRDGDIVYWVKDPKKRVVGEIVAHLSVVRIKAGKPYVIHAAGNKDHKDRPGGGVVKEVPFVRYVRNMRFIGAFVTRFEQ